MASTMTMRVLMRGEADASSTASASGSAPRRSHRHKPMPPRIAHGQRLACFRPRQRFTMRPTCRVPGALPDERLVCGCPPFQPLQCHYARLEAATASASANNGGECLNMVALHYQTKAKRKKWTEKFASHDWETHEVAKTRVCQKWREYQKKFPRKNSKHTTGNMAESAVLVDMTELSLSSASSAEEEPSSGQRVSAGKAVKNAFTSMASAAELRLLSGKFEGLVRAGVPPHLRGQVWWLCSGAADKRDAASGVESYRALVKRIPMLSKRAAMEIEKDLPRTFPNDASSVEKELRAKSLGELRRVLQAYCLRNPVVGYCQSMNFLAAVLLQFLEEEEAFWVLVSMVEELIPQYHTKTMLGSRAEQRVFTELVQQKLPAVDQHMQHLGVDLEPFTLKWFLCLFFNTLPLEPVMRIWDLFFCEGSHVLLRVGLTLLKLAQPRILACDDAIDVYEMFKFSHETLIELTAPHRSGLLNRDECVCDTLVRLAMDKSFVGVIAFDSLHELRHLYRNEVAAELQQAEERRTRQTTTRPASAVEEEDEDEDEILATGFIRHAEAERELHEYDFVEEYAYHCGDVSPSKHIHFSELRAQSSTSVSDASSDELFVDVDYDA